MIRIHRGAEPEALRRVREWRLARALIDWATHPETRWSLVEHDQRFSADAGVARTQLWHAQHDKCAYCEIIISHAEDVEHFRPRRRYWWLTWSWHNHFAVCGTCSGAKGHDFPLLRDDPPGSAPRLIARRLPDLPQDQADIEAPRWVDPAREDPRDFIRFHLETRGPGTRWTPSGIDDSDRGQHTIDDFALAHPDRVDQLNDYLADLEDPLLDLAEVRAAARAGCVDERAWHKLIRRSVGNVRAPWRSLAHDYLAHVRTQLHDSNQVELPPLPDLTDRTPPPPPAPLFAPDPLLDRLAPLDALYVRSARAPKVPCTHQQRALLALLTLRDEWPLAELCSLLLDKRASTLRRWIGNTPGLALHRGTLRRASPESA